VSGQNDDGGQSLVLVGRRHARISTSRAVAPIMYSCAHGFIAKHRLESGNLSCVSADGHQTLLSVRIGRYRHRHSQYTRQHTLRGRKREMRVCGLTCTAPSRDALVNPCCRARPMVAYACSLRTST